MSSALMAIVNERHTRIKAQLLALNERTAILEEHTERAGETDGFRQYDFVDLPTPTEVRFAFVVDGLGVGETTGNGTGCLAVYKPNHPSSPDWYRVADNTVVQS